MKENKKISTLINIIKKNQQVLVKIEKFYDNFIKEEIIETQKKQYKSIIISDIITNYYTCLETIFLRISKFFENDLTNEKWHQDLLEKMTLEIDGIREKVISEDTYNILFELLKFRHFKRYYFELEYDWDKLEFLQKKFLKLKILIKNDMDNFIKFLNKLL